MHTSLAVWNFAWQGEALGSAVDRAADLGCDTVSLLPQQWLEASPGDRQLLQDALERSDLAVTLHGKFSLVADDLRRLVDALSPRLRCLTFDRLDAAGPYGPIPDPQGMAEHLRLAGELTAASGARFGVEDYPLNARELTECRQAWGAVAEQERLGVLVDVGHLNLRLRSAGGVDGQAVEAAIAALPLEVVEIHIHDNSGLRDTHQPLGEGNLPVSRVARALRAAGSAGVVHTVEIAPSLHGATAEEDWPAVGRALDRWLEAWG